MEIVYTIPHAFGPGSDSSENATVLRLLLELLIALDIEYLRRHPNTPSLYEDPIFYRRTVEWEPIPAIRLRGFADCKSLTAWRVAELRLLGEEAKPVFRWRRTPRGTYDYHILVLRPGGLFEDPSKAKGMSDSENGGAMRAPLDEVLDARAMMVSGSVD